MRLFVGMNPPAEARTDAAEALDLRVGQPAPGVRWVPQERWHVTLAFLGEVDPDRVPRLVDALQHVADEHAALMAMHLAGAGTFRGSLWLGVHPTERHSPADHLARGVQRAMRAAGIAVERRPWRAHLTVARWRSSPELDRQGRDLAAGLDYAGPTFDIDAIRLVHSVTGPNPTYSDLAVVALRAGG